MGTRKVLFIGLVWPEPQSSAAGTRILQLVKLFEANGDEVHFASAASFGEFSFDLKSLSIITHEIVLNNSCFNEFAKQLQPDIVVFDRYVTEEQFGWRLLQECPNAIRILDTEDLHFLRLARQQSIKKGLQLTETDFYSDTAKREIASILRCDLSLLISEVEMEILKSQFGIAEEILFYLPFLEDKINEESLAGWNVFSDRKDLIFMGNFLHEPNWNTALVLKNEIWPVLSKLLPSASLHVYGAYASQKVFQLQNKAERFLVHGRAGSATATIAQHKILLAPIKFGAGAKGKLIDAMLTGTPSVTTTIGAESMHGNLEWPGFIANDTAEFCEFAKTLYEDETIWKDKQQNAAVIINERYAREKFGNAFLIQLAALTSNLASHRQLNFIGQILNHQTLQSTKYMSLWIEEKNK